MERGKKRNGGKGGKVGRWEIGRRRGKGERGEGG